MPITPLHLGPAALIKSFLPRHFSFLVFAFSQFLIDLEPLYFILREEMPLHRFFHTFAGATLLGLISYLLGRPIAGISSHFLAGQLKWNWQSLRLATQHISHVSAFSAAWLGVYSHIALDSIMHSDVFPLTPILDSSPLHALVTVDTLHIYCVGSGLLGCLLIGMRALYPRDREAR